MWCYLGVRSGFNRFVIVVGFLFFVLVNQQVVFIRMFPYLCVLSLFGLSLCVVFCVSRVYYHVWLSVCFVCWFGYARVFDYMCGSLCCWYSLRSYSLFGVFLFGVLCVRYVCVVFLFV